MAGLCQSLEAEHRVIEKVLDALEREAGRIEDGQAPDTDFFRKAIAFVRQFADGLHHQKEEQILFPGLTDAGVPERGGPVGVMLEEHAQARQLIATMDDALEAAGTGDLRAQAALSDAALHYVILLRQHIQKEDGVLFPLAENMFDPSRKVAVLDSFRKAEEENPERDAAHRDWAEALG